MRRGPARRESPFYAASGGGTPYMTPRPLIGMYTTWPARWSAHICDAMPKPSLDASEICSHVVPRSRERKTATSAEYVGRPCMKRSGGPCAEAGAPNEKKFATDVDATAPQLLPPSCERNIGIGVWLGSSVAAASQRSPAHAGFTSSVTLVRHAVGIVPVEACSQLAPWSALTKTPFQLCT